MIKEEQLFKILDLKERIRKITIAIEVLISEQKLFVFDFDALHRTCNLLSLKRELLREDLKELEDEVIK